MSFDLLFRLAIAAASVTGCFLYFRTKAAWVRQYHSLIGIMVLVLCFVTYFIR